MAEKELADAKLAIGRNDGKALLNDESSYAKAVSSAEHALSLAKAANSPSVAEVEGELAKVVNAWNRSVVPSLRKYRGK